jgi:hypothetical protein
MEEVKGYSKSHTENFDVGLDFAFVPVRGVRDLHDGQGKHDQ